MADLTVDLIVNDDDYPEELALDENGELTGTRHYRVLGTRDKVVAIGAPGVPRRGEPWSVGEPGLLVRSVQPLTARGEAVKVRVGYATAGAGGGGGVLPTPGLIFTRMSSETVSETVRTGVNGEDLGRDGATVNRLVGGMVVEHHRTSPLPPLTLLGASYVADPNDDYTEVFRTVVNDRPVTVPPFYKWTEPGTTFGPGELLYLGAEMEDDAAPLVYVARFRFRVAPDHRWRWRDLDEHDRPIGDIREADLVPAADLTGLWPGM